MFYVALTLTGSGVFAGNEDGLIKTGYYVWKIINPNGSVRHDRLYIKSNGESLEFYSMTIFLKATITENRFEGITERGEKYTYINGSVDAKGQVTGYYECWNVFEPNKKDRFEFVVQEDTAPDASAYWENYFKGFSQIQARNDKLIFSKTSVGGRQMRAKIEKMAQEEDVSFAVKGKIIDSSGYPVAGVVIELSARAHDPDGAMGMKGKIKYVTSNKDGYFESETLSGYLLGISYRGEEYQYFTKDFRGKKELLKLKDNPVIIKLEPNAKSK